MKQGLIIFFILLLLACRLATPIDLPMSDLGRHLKSGELILHGQWDVLYKNYYSYTCSQYPFVNHHWLFGVLCFCLWHFFGFSGLSFIYLILELLTFYVFFRIAERHSSFGLACIFGLLSFPLISSRPEIRPEGISYLFCGLFWWSIDAYREKRLKPQYLMAGLSFLQIIWVNTHIFFIVGPVLTLVLAWQARADNQGQEASFLLKVFLILLAASFINPSGIDGFLAPFHFNKAYNYPIGENQPIFFRLRYEQVFCIYFLSTLLMLGVVLIYLIYKQGFQQYFFIGVITLLLGLLAMKAERLVGPYGYFWIPIASYVYGRWLNDSKEHFQKNIKILLSITAIVVSISVNFNWGQRHGFGLMPGVNDAAEFFKKENIQGPIFNNYDIGGYLIFHLSPQYRFFADNRMEAYPVDFWKKTYIPTEFSNDQWHQMEQRYHFNAIFITVDHAPWGLWFLAHRLSDPSWALVFFNGEELIFLKRDQQNMDIIRRYEIIIRHHKTEGAQSHEKLV